LYTPPPPIKMSQIQAVHTKFSFVKLKPVLTKENVVRAA
jgi:hypothetical protein